MRGAAAALIGLILLPGASGAMAQTSTGSGLPFAPPSHRHGLERRFADANTSHDGHLTVAQAQAGDWHSVVNNFAAMDVGAKGYVTMEDIHAFNKQRRAARRAAAGAD